MGNKVASYPQGGLFQPVSSSTELLPARLLPVSRRDRLQGAQGSPTPQPARRLSEATSAGASPLRGRGLRGIPLPPPTSQCWCDVNNRETGFHHPSHRLSHV